MSNHNSHKRLHSRWIVWAPGLLTVLVLYVLTLPLVVHFATTPYPSDPVWLAWYLEPYRWVYDFAPVRHYHDWCSERLGASYQYR